MGYKVHLTESCDIDGVGLITKVITTPALTQDVSCTEVIQRPLMAKGLRPEEFNQDRLDIDWDIERVTFPKGKRSSRWILKRSEAGMPSILVFFRQEDCNSCSTRSLCTRARGGPPGVKSCGPELNMRRCGLPGTGSCRRNKTSLSTGCGLEGK